MKVFKLLHPRCMDFYRGKHGKLTMKKTKKPKQQQKEIKTEEER